MLTSQEIRRQFIAHFTDRCGHTYVPSSSVVPLEDPTLLFANAGMNQFKPYFLATQQPPYPRAVNTQKCIRAGGKHNDLEDVGKDTYHHTFFEMLGNWSFGDYFKKEAIDWAWDLLVNQWGLEPARLHATYFQGDPVEGLEADTEARDLWLQYLPKDQVHPGNKKDNFWEMGDTGPCGPCSEIHVDRTADLNGGKLVNAGDARVMEIWNLVFIQFNRDSDGKLAPLPAKHVDTGMGFERVCSVIQGTTSNYDTDVFTPIFSAIQQVTKARAYAGSLEDPIDIAYRVLADHIRCLTFALTDGAMPSNEGRGYVLRRILRRAVRHGRQTLGVNQPFFYQLVDSVVGAMGDAFPELRKNPQQVMGLIKEEEVSFGRTLDRGIELFEQAVRDAQASCDREAAVCLAAADAFKLYDTFGFPLDLTQVMAEERGMKVDVAGFEKLMQQQREQSRAGAAGDDGIDLAAACVELASKYKLPMTEFIGYEMDKLSCTLTTTVNHYPLPGGYVALITGTTPFYAEKGGQVGDTGTLSIRGATMLVMHTYSVGPTHVHVGKVKGLLPADGSHPVTFQVDASRRERIMAHHTATHVLNHKLRAVLGDHVTQKGSLVDENKTRFDFAHPTALSDEELAKVEAMVNADVQANLPVHAQIAAQEKALQIHGLRAVFGEKYPPMVRVVSIGPEVSALLTAPTHTAWYESSVEFCGGTHLASTGQIGRFTLMSEEAVGKGVRRLIGVAGNAAQTAQTMGETILQSTANPSDPAKALVEINDAMGSGQLPLLVKSRLQARMVELQKRVKDAEKARAKESASAAVAAARAIAEACHEPIIVARIDAADGEALRMAMDVIRRKHPDAAVLLGGTTGADKVFFVAAVPPAMVKTGLRAGDWVKEAAKVCGGGGGGRPDMAQAGGKDAGKLAAALEAAKIYADGKQ